MSKQDDFHRPEKPLEKMQEIDNEARISKETEMKRKLNRNQKRITPLDIQLSSLTFLIIVTIKNVVFLLKLDVKNTGKLIVTAVINFLSWNLQGVAKKIKSQTCVKFFFFYK